MLAVLALFSQSLCGHLLGPPSLRRLRLGQVPLGSSRAPLLHGTRSGGRLQHCRQRYRRLINQACAHLLGEGVGRRALVCGRFAAAHVNHPHAEDKQHELAHAPRDARETNWHGRELAKLLGTDLCVCAERTQLATERPLTQRTSLTTMHATETHRAVAVRVDLLLEITQLHNPVAVAVDPRVPHCHC